VTSDDVVTTASLAEPGISQAWLLGLAGIGGYLLVPLLMEFLEVTIQCEDLAEKLNIDLNGQ
jgi:hypothetical protein